MYCSMIYTIHRHVTSLDECSLRIYIEYSNYTSVDSSLSCTCYDYNRDGFCVYSVVQNRLFPVLKKS